MSTGTQGITRQWVSMPGGSSDLRVGKGAIDVMGSILKGSVGKPRLCALACDASTTPELREQVRRQLTDAGFRVTEVEVATGPAARTLGAVEELATRLSEVKVTADDLVCAIGGGDALSLCSFVCASWCGGTPLVHVPVDLLSAVEVGTVPWGIDIAGLPQMLTARSGAKYVICDLDLIKADPASAESITARALMATAAICDAEAAVQRLWDRAELLVDGDVESLREQLADTAKSRGHLISSTSIATRQSAAFGQTFANAVARLVGPEVPRGLLLAEAVRFQSRIAAATGILKVDDVLTFDELLDLLALEPVSCDVDPDALVEALKAERFLRSNRFILCLPRGIARVRPASVDDEVLREHAEAWCASRAAL